MQWREGGVGSPPVLHTVVEKVFSRRVVEKVFSTMVFWYPGECVLEEWSVLGKVFFCFVEKVFSKRGFLYSESSSLAMSMSTEMQREKERGRERERE